MLWSKEDKARVINLVNYYRTQMVEKLGLSVYTIDEIKFLRTPKIYGRCRKYTDKTAIISISAMCLENEEVLKNTIVHELCHAMPNTQGHDKAWKTYANMAGDAFGMIITDKGTIEESKAVAGYKEKYRGELPYRYIIHCQGCGLEVKYKRLTRRAKAIVTTNKYICTCCGCSDFTLEAIQEGF